MIRIYKILPHLVFIALLVSVLSPSLVSIANKWVFLGVIIFIEVLLVGYHKSKSANDIALIIFIVLFVWEFSTTKTTKTNTMLVPVPEKVFAVFLTDWKKILSGIIYSLRLLFTAMAIALFFAIGLGMIVGWFERLRKSLLPIAKIISPIPPIVYTPYVVALAPSFRIASLFIIFSSIFWPVFINMVISVSTVDRGVMDSAKTLNTKSVSMFLHILFPYCLPRIITGMNITLSISFMVLTAAELIGARSGLGWFVKYYSDYADYTRVFAGIIVIAVVVTALNKLLLIVEKFLIKWR
jgi:NitT/TauT family transport system permease protein